MTNLIKIVLAILFLLCLADMPYGYYQLVRFLAMVGFAYLAYEARNNANEMEMYIFIGLAVLFQPLIKIALGRVLWNVVDLIVAVGLIMNILKSPSQKTNI